VTPTVTRTLPVPAPPVATPPVLGQAARFLLVGGACTVVDVGVFNLLHAAGVGPLTSKVCSTVVAGVAAFVGNRQWSFGASDGHVRRQAVAFLLVNLASLALALLPLAVARYVLGLTSVLDLNIACNVIGLGLATGLRFWGYRRWVFPDAAAVPARDEDLGEEPVRLAA
jgi:putative flippase GtrA